MNGFYIMATLAFNELIWLYKLELNHIVFRYIATLLEFFSSATWLPHGQIWRINERATSLS